MTNIEPANGQFSLPLGLGAPEPLLTIAEAAGRLGIHAWALRRAVKRGEVPSYSAFNNRKRVRLTDVIAAIEASKMGGK